MGGRTPNTKLMKTFITEELNYTINRHHSVIGYCVTTGKGKKTEVQNLFLSLLCSIYPGKAPVVL